MNYMWAHQQENGGMMTLTPFIYMMKKTGFWVIVLTVISFISISSFSIAQKASISSPSEVFINKSFEVSIDSGNSNLYDVKLYVLTENGSIISSIQDSGWKSSRYYIKESYPNQKIYSLIVNKPGQTAKICLKLRLSGKTNALPEVCSPISISNSEVKEEPTLQYQEDIIYLNSNYKNEIITAKPEKIRLGISLTFFIFLFICIILILWKKL
jgi:hypothetical protein